MDGDHTMEKCSQVTKAALHGVFCHLYQQRVLMEGMIVKPNMVLPGRACSIQPGVEENGGRHGELPAPRHAGSGHRHCFPLDCPESPVSSRQESSNALPASSTPGMEEL